MTLKRAASIFKWTLTKRAKKMNIELLPPDKKMLIKAAVQLCEKLDKSPQYYAGAVYSGYSGCLHTWVLPKEEPLMHIEGVILEHLVDVSTSTPGADNALVDELRGLLS